MLAAAAGVRLAATAGAVLLLFLPPPAQVTLGLCGLSAWCSRSSAAARWSRPSRSSWPPGDLAGAGWVLVGPAAPFYAAGLIGVVRGPGQPRRGLAARDAGDVPAEPSASGCRPAAGARLVVRLAGAAGRGDRRRRQRRRRDRADRAVPDRHRRSARPSGGCSGPRRPWPWRCRVLRADGQPDAAHGHCSAPAEPAIASPLFVPAAQPGWSRSSPRCTTRSPPGPCSAWSCCTCGTGGRPRRTAAGSGGCWSARWARW